MSSSCFFFPYYYITNHHYHHHGPTTTNNAQQQPNPPVRAAAFIFFSVSFFIRYFLYLHFKCYPESPLHPPPALLPNPPTPASWPWHSPVLGHMIFTRPRASPLIDDQLGHPLLHMQLKPWVPPCALFSWWFSPWEVWGVWLVDIVVLPIEL